MKKAIVTLCVGKSFYQRWQSLCEKNWNEYAWKNGYDIIVLDQLLDDSSLGQNRSPAWQKCLILEDPKVKEYDRVVWIDSDVLLNSNAPCIVEGVPEDKVGICDAFEQYLGNDYQIPQKITKGMSWPFNSAREYYKIAKLDCSYNQVTQTGVMVMSPKFHKKLLLNVYQNGSGTPIGDYEMETLSYEILKSQSEFWLDWRFNSLWTAWIMNYYPFLQPQKSDHLLKQYYRRMTRGHRYLPPVNFTKECLSCAYDKSYFLHFAGVTEFMSLSLTN